MASRRSKRASRASPAPRWVSPSIAVLNLDDRVVDLYGSTRAALERRGIVKSDFDLLIACTAVGQGAVLVTNDQGLLDVEIDGLRTENWLAAGPEV